MPGAYLLFRVIKLFSVILKLKVGLEHICCFVLLNCLVLF
uniref:Uncharacterized protein n=1 Tax=Ciona intestinalis TaxID=7719 RepID=H2Y3P7_CIOIN